MHDRKERFFFLNLDFYAWGGFDSPRCWRLCWLAAADFSNFVPPSSVGYFLLSAALVCSEILFSWLLATSSAFTRADCSVRTQLETGTCVGGSVTCSSQRCERARNIANMFSQLCVLCLFCIYIYIFSKASAVVHVSVGVCLPERGLGACGREARETGLNSTSLAPQLSSDGSVRIWGDTLVASALKDASNTHLHRRDRGATESAPLGNCWCWSTGVYLNGSLWYFI